MSALKKLLVLTFTALVLICSNAYAENNAEVKDAIEKTIAKLEEASAALAKGTDAKAVVDMVIEAKQLQKSISTSDAKVSIKKSQGSNKLGQARTALNEGDVKKGGELVDAALADYKEVKEKYNATH